MYFRTNRKSRSERRKHFRFPDYLLMNKNVTELFNNKIKLIIRENIPECKLLRLRYNGRES